ncbi:histidine kinase [Pontibacter sp. KCTC 32443]|uniref:sensor histidine kinase n=2 Tax=Pontibacter TaxID=323449 RepID=UPI0019A7060B|nr:histidine kinase [Pontibacter deserti]MBC5772576.1 histidine kinase [Pontibacter sp. KCTC 32443]
MTTHQSIMPIKSEILHKYKWPASLLFWLFVGILYVLYTTLLDMHASTPPVVWYQHSSYKIAVHIVWGVVTVPYLQLLSRAGAPNKWVKYILLTIAAAAIHAFVSVISYGLLASIISFDTTFEAGRYWDGGFYHFSRLFFISWLTTIVIFIAWLGWENLQANQRQAKLNAELQSQLVQTQLQMLRMQLNPHFIFNTFNTISMMVRANKNEEATDMLAKLAELLRISLYKNEKQLIPLHKELEYCRHYLDIELVRFKDRLKVEFDVQPETEKILVPGMILQPLLENAFKHGLMNSIDSSPILRIESHQLENDLIISIKNTGKLETTVFNGNGIGLQNVRERLKLHYGDKAHFALEQQNGLVLASINIAS